MDIVNYSNSQYHDLRIDKNIAYNILSFRNFQTDAKLLKAVAIYMAINHQEEDLFGFHKLDPTVFAKYMFLHEKDLKRIHPEPFFKEIDEKSDKLIEDEQKHGRMSSYRTWSSHLENALYILTHKTLIDDYRISLGNKEISNSKRFNFIDEIRFELVPTGKTKKIMYYYKPNKAYVQNLKTYFLNTNINIYTSLKKPKLDDAYLHLLNWINNYNHKNQNSIAFNIDFLASILSIKPYSRFSNYKRKVTEKFEILRKKLENDIKGLKLTWVNPNDSLNKIIDKIEGDHEAVKYANVAIVSWDRKTKKEKDLADKKTFQNIFDTQLNRALIKSFLRTPKGKLTVSEDDVRDSFYRWILSKSDMDIKGIEYQATYLRVYGETISLKRYLADFLKLLERVSSIQEEHKAIKWNEDYLMLSLKDKKIKFKHLYELLNFVREKFEN